MCQAWISWLCNSILSCMYKTWKPTWLQVYNMKAENMSVNCFKVLNNSLSAVINQIYLTYMYTLDLHNLQGSRVGTVVRMLASHQCVPGSIPGPGVIQCMWVEFVVGSLLCSERFFSGYYGFPLSLKTTFPNSNSILECTDISERVRHSLVVRG